MKNGNLIISASGVGTIIANQDVKDPNGMVTMLLSAQLSYLQAQENYESLVSSIPSELATAEQDLITAQATLKTAKSDRAVYNYPKCDEDETASARSAYELAQEQYDLNPTFEGTRITRTPSANLQNSPGNLTGRNPRGFTGGFPGSGEPGGGFIISGGPGGEGMMFDGTSATPNASQRATLEVSRNNLTSSPFTFNLIIRYLEGKITPNK